MRKQTVFWVVLGVSAMLFMAHPGSVSADELAWHNVAGLMGRTGVDVHSPQACDQCDDEGCVSRVPVQDCARGKKKVYDSSVRYEYVAIPETRYRWKTRLVTKDVPCEYCKPVCRTDDAQRCFETENWEATPSGCGELHCKTCQAQVENVPCPHCGREPGETSTRVHYFSCVKEAYIVYRQVRRPVCVKQPRYEHVEVPITRYECNQCGTRGCGGDCGHSGGCESGCQ